MRFSQASRLRELMAGKLGRLVKRYEARDGGIQDDTQ